MTRSADTCEKYYSIPCYNCHMANCMVEDCERPVKAQGYCDKHYQRWKSHGDPLVALKPYGRHVVPTCSVEGCDDPALARELCRKHYQRWKAHGDPLVLLLDRSKTPEERFWPFVDKDGPVPEKRPELGPCWLWTGGKAEGYGVFHLNGKQAKAHIFSYTLAVGPIEDGQERDHLCRVRHCVRPDHLEAVTRQINQLRGFGVSGISSRKTHCINGHEFSPENTYVNGKGHRVCRTCRSEAMRRYQQKRSEAG